MIPPHSTQCSRRRLEGTQKPPLQIHPLFPFLVPLHHYPQARVVRVLYRLLGPGHLQIPPQPPAEAVGAPRKTLVLLPEVSLEVSLRSPLLLLSLSSSSRGGENAVIPVQYWGITLPTITKFTKPRSCTIPRTLPHSRLPSLLGILPTPAGTPRTSTRLGGIKVLPSYEVRYPTWFP